MYEQRKATQSKKILAEMISSMSLFVTCMGLLATFAIKWIEPTVKVNNETSLNEVYSLFFLTTLLVFVVFALSYTKELDYGEQEEELKEMIREESHKAFEEIYHSL